MQRASSFHVFINQSILYLVYSKATSTGHVSGKHKFEPDSDLPQKRSFGGSCSQEDKIQPYSISRLVAVGYVSLFINDRFERHKTRQILKN